MRGLSVSDAEMAEAGAAGGSADALANEAAVCGAAGGHPPAAESQSFHTEVCDVGGDGGEYVSVDGRDNRHPPAADSELTGAEPNDVNGARAKNTFDERRRGSSASAADFTDASALVGSTPRGAARRVSLALRHCLERLDLRQGPLVIATSGGADSLALAVAGIDLGRRWGMDVHTVTVDHGLRPESDAEAHEVAQLCEKLGAHAHCVRVEVGHLGGPEGAARDARRAALIQIAHQVASAWQMAGLQIPVLLGHTQDDQAETVLLRLARGAGAHSLRAMDPVSDWAPGVLALRPLLDVRRADTHAACAQWGLHPVEDPTNCADGPWRAADGSALRRAAVREHALPALAQALGMDPVPALARSASLLAKDDQALAVQAQTALEQALVEAAHLSRHRLPNAGSDQASNGKHAASSAQTSSITCATWLAVDRLPTQPAIRDRVLRLAALRAGARAANLSAQHIQALSALVTHWHGQGPVQLPGGVRGHRQKGLLKFNYAEGEPDMNQ